MKAETPTDVDPVDLSDLEFGDLITADPRRAFQIALAEFDRLVPGAGPVDVEGGA